jgi:hypothetical protein
MKEPILEFLENTEPENKAGNIESSEFDPAVEMKKLANNRKKTMNEWKTKFKEVNNDKVEKRTL